MELDLDWVMSAAANTSAIERRAATLPGPPVGQEGAPGGVASEGDHADRPDDACGRRHPRPGPRLCAKARQPVRADLLEALGMPPITVGAVCVYHEMVETAVAALEGSGIPVAAVSTGFPAGLSPFTCASPRSAKA
jgi:deoxyribose-phosphate aldolase